MRFLPGRDRETVRGYHSLAEILEGGEAVLARRGREDLTVVECGWAPPACLHLHPVAADPPELEEPLSPVLLERMP